MPRRRCNIPRGLARQGIDAPQHYNCSYRHARRYGRRWCRCADAYQSKPASAVAAATRRQAGDECAREVVQRVWRRLCQYSRNRCLRQNRRLGDGGRFGQSRSLIGRAYRAGAVPAAVRQSPLIAAVRACSVGAGASWRVHVHASGVCWRNISRCQSWVCTPG